MLVIPTQVAEVTFNLRPLSVLPAQLLSLDPLIRVNGWEPCVLSQSELHPPEEGDPLEVSLSNCGAPCLLLHLLFLLR